MGLLTSMGNMLNGTWALFASLLLMMIGNGLQGTLLGIRGDNEGFTTIALSLIATGYYAGYFLGSFVVPNFIKRVGYIRVFAALVAFASVAAIFYAMFVQHYAWFIMRFITGFCFAGIYMVAESWLNYQTHNDNRAKVLAVYVIILYVGLSVGQVLLNFGDINGYFLFAIASIIISLAAVPLLLTSRPSPIIPETSSLSLKKLYQRSPLGVVATFLVNFMVAGILGMAAIYAKSIGMETKLISLFISLCYIGCITFQFPVGYISDRMDRRKIITALTLLSSIVALIASKQENHYLLIILFTLLGGLVLPLYALCIAYVNDRLEPEEILPATSALLIISGMASMFAPVIIGFLMENYDASWFFKLPAIVAITVTLFALYRMMVSENIKVDDMADYAPIGVATTVATMSLTHEDAQLEFNFEINDDLETTEEPAQ